MFGESQPQALHTTESIVQTKHGTKIKYVIYPVNTIYNEILRL